MLNKILEHKMISKLNDKFNILVVSVGIIAVALMFCQFFMRHGFWMDEISLAENFMTLTFTELFEPLHADQVAPFGFVFWEWAVWQLAGKWADIEYWWRIYPFCCGLGVVFLYYPTAYRLTGSKVIALFSYLFLVLTSAFIYYTSEMKQYIAELFFAVLLLYFWATPGKKWTTERVWTLISVIAIGILNSLTMCFVLLPLGLWDGFELLKKARYQIKTLSEDKNLRLYILQYGTALALLLVYYFAFLYKHQHAAFMDNYWQFAFVNADNFAEIFRHTGEFFCKALSVYILVPAVLSLLCLKNKFPFFFAVVIILTHTFFSYFRLYPLYERLILYWLSFLPLATACLWYYAYDFICRMLKKYGYVFKYQAVALTVGMLTIIGVQIAQPLKLPIYMNGLYMKYVWKYIQPQYNSDDMLITDHARSASPYMQKYYLDEANLENIIDVPTGDWYGSWWSFLYYVFTEILPQDPHKRFWLVVKRGSKEEIEKIIGWAIQEGTPDISLRYCAVPIDLNTVCLLERTSTMRRFNGEK